MHIDTSRRFYQKGTTAIAYKIISSQQHKGIVISEKLKRELDRDLGAKDDYAKQYAICIYYLIKDNLNEFDVLVICNDEDFLYVKLYLDLLLIKNTPYGSKTITSISELRKITGNKKLRSYANNIANIYRRKGFKKIHRRQKWISLNLIKLTYKEIHSKWIYLDELLKKR